MRSIHRHGAIDYRGHHLLPGALPGLDVHQAGSIHESAATDGATWAKRA